MTNSTSALPTVTGLRPYQASLLASKYFEVCEWSKVKSYAKDNNIFETNRVATSNRYAHHLVKILSSLTSEQLEVVAYGSDRDRISALWLGFCHAFPLVGDFAETVVSEKYRNRYFKLKAEDLWEFISDKSVEFSNLNNLSDAMRSKAKSVIFYNLRDAGLLNGFDEIQMANLSDLMVSLITPEERGFFPGEEF